jgi:hypothetical protein
MVNSSQQRPRTAISNRRTQLNINRNNFSLLGTSKGLNKADDSINSSSRKKTMIIVQMDGSNHSRKDASVQSISNI